MNPQIELEVRRRAGRKCEYCLLHEANSTLRFVVDHILARQHGGTTTLENLAVCCGHCNLYKGPNIAGIDTETGKLTRLYNPRIDSWRQHFRRRGVFLVGLTPVGRTTAAVLGFNRPGRVRMRRALLALGELRV